MATTYKVLAQTGSSGSTGNGSATLTATTNTNLYTVPSGTFTAGNIVNLFQIGAGVVTVTGATGVTINSHNGLKTAAQYAVASVACLGSDAFVVFGDVTA